MMLEFSRMVTTKSQLTFNFNYCLKIFPKQHSPYYLPLAGTFPTLQLGVILHYGWFVVTIYQNVGNSWLSVL